MLNILIIDDEAPARNRLRRMLANIPSVFFAGEAATGHEALELIASTDANVLLLDISMPGMDGMTLARLLREQGSAPAIIFCTAWSDQAVEAFECDAVDYLVKPVRAERLEVALDKARRYLTRDDAESDGPFLRTTLGSKVQLLPVSDVICLHAEDKYTTVVHKNGRLMIDQSLLDLENEYADILLRVHRSTLVVIKCIRGLEKSQNGRHFLQLEGCEDRPQVSRRNLPAVRKLIRELT
jgi:two-component system response regulator AlgR